jgi:hypothetical protein
MMPKARVEFAPDGKHFQIVKSGTSEKMWDYFTQNRDIREQMILNPQAKFRMIGETGITIGVLAFDRKKKEFVHLKDVI